MPGEGHSGQRTQQGKAWGGQLSTSEGKREGEGLEERRAMSTTAGIWRFPSVTGKAGDGLGRRGPV